MKLLQLGLSFPGANRLFNWLSSYILATLPIPQCPYTSFLDITHDWSMIQAILAQPEGRGGLHREQGGSQSGCNRDL